MSESISLPPHDPTARVDVRTLYEVQIGHKTIVLTDQQASDLFVALNGLFGSDLALSQRMDELDGEMDAIGRETRAVVKEIKADFEESVAAMEKMLLAAMQFYETKAHDPLFRQGKPWTKEEDDRLCELLRTDKTFPEMAVLMGRSAASVQTRANYPNFYRIRHPKQAERDQERLSEASAAIATLVRERVTA